MKKYRHIIQLTISLAAFTACSKDNTITNNNDNFCGTVATLPAWTQNVTSNVLVGDWKITEISYGKGSGSTHYFDTTYYPNHVINFSDNGSGTLDFSIPITWGYSTVSNNFPQMTVTNINSLFTFPVNFIYNDSVDLSLGSNPGSYFDSYPHQRFFAGYGKGQDGNWEQGSIKFERQ